ncbi:MAG: TatD family nuclease-associated radical SAM protein [Kiritimatiellae bacterium]|nr:TatD family nuclease-associated radical SAM protein [Kiritimatiellia bacterium]
MLITYPLKTGLYVNLTNRCPCACDFCLRNNAPGVYGTGSLWLEREPTVEEVIESIEHNLQPKITEVIFCGYGEPTERLDALLEVAAYLRENHPGLKIRVNTNGLSDLIWNRSTAADFKGKVDTLSISLNTDDEEEYNNVCHPKFGLKSYKAMLKFAKDAAGTVPEVVMTIVDEPVTSKEKQARCRAIAESIGARLRIRPYETTGDSELKS